MELTVRDDHYQIYEDFRLCLNETLIGRENYLFNYYSQQEGLEDLRQSVQQLLLDSAIYTSADKIVLTSGTQQALYILSQIAFPNEKYEILVEQPTYHRINDLLTAQQLLLYYPALSLSLGAFLQSKGEGRNHSSCSAL